MTRVLIVDDNEQIRNLISEYLSMQGYDVDIAEDGIEAFKKTIILKYNLIILDFQMPKMNGIDTIKAIRMNLPAIPVIIISGIHDKAFIKKVEEEGADAYFSKPFDIEQLFIKVKQLINNN